MKSLNTAFSFAPPSILSLTIYLLFGGVYFEQCNQKNMLGYFIMFAWLAIMITAMILLRKNKANFLSFILPWFMGLVACLVAVFVIL